MTQHNKNQSHNSSAPERVRARDLSRGYSKTGRCTGRGRDVEFQVSQDIAASPIV
jgi:hypothetical protein